MKSSTRSSNSDFSRDVVTACYRSLLGREPDRRGLEAWVKEYEDNPDWTALLRAFVSGEEFRLRHQTGPDGKRLTQPLEALHASRVQMVRQLPKARRIVDLGGGSVGDPRGAMVLMGYPYQFDRLTIVEANESNRHEIYQGVGYGLTEVKTEQGTVDYLYGSMADLSAIPSDSVDLVFAGETIEHVNLDDCKRTLAEVFRVLRRGGEFCFDTPNRRITELQFPNAFINPDHKIEYRHAEMQSLVLDSGLKIMEAKGINYMPKAASTGKFSGAEFAEGIGMFADIEDCYLLYYRCEKTLHPERGERKIELGD